MKAFITTTFALLIGVAAFANGNNVHDVATASLTHAAHTPWYVFAGIVFVAVVLSALTIANAEPKN